MVVDTLLCINVLAVVSKPLGACDALRGASGTGAQCLDGTINA